MHLTELCFSRLLSGARLGYFASGLNVLRKTGLIVEYHNCDAPVSDASFVGFNARLRHFITTSRAQYWLMVACQKIGRAHV